MKNLKIYKSALTLVTATTAILLLSGCTSSNNNGNNNNKEKSCTHLTVYFQDTPVTFKECEGYDISVSRHGQSSEIDYKIVKNDMNIISGITTIYNTYEVYHNVADELIDEESVQKSK